jgi:hypothetical protein
MRLRSLFILHAKGNYAHTQVRDLPYEICAQLAFLEEEIALG